MQEQYKRFAFATALNWKRGKAPTDTEVSEAWKARRFRWRVIEGKRKKVFQTREDVETDGAKLCRCPVCFSRLEWRGDALICPADGCEGAWIEY